MADCMRVSWTQNPRTVLFPEGGEVCMYVCVCVCLSDVSGRAAEDNTRPRKAFSLVRLRTRKEKEMCVPARRRQIRESSHVRVTVIPRDAPSLAVFLTFVASEAAY